MKNNTSNTPTLSPNCSSAFVDILEKAGIIGDHNIKDEKKREEKQQKARSSYHCTTSLLKNYRKIVWALECYPGEVAAELDRPLEDLDAILDGIDVETSLYNRKLENRLESILRSRLLIDRVNEALTFLQKKPGDGKTLYDIIYHTYVSPDNLNNADVIKLLGISQRHYYRLRTEAIELLSLRLWSTSSRVLDLWLEISSIFEHQE